MSKKIIIELTDEEFDKLQTFKNKIDSANLLDASGFAKEMLLDLVKNSYDFLEPGSNDFLEQFTKQMKMASEQMKNASNMDIAKFFTDIMQNSKDMPVTPTTDSSEKEEKTTEQKPPRVRKA
ncbi:hypothetical protein OF376_00680 [Ureaplasma miroungigenitalium]|uniref:Uncharacterized protein n=1 Tax=Ureaplasma miroungigenitalium TaxID=1042321 RepID=A0ABT3BM24_9BACT|nr:hypothetical protein [Ureaplasma miroungigenitalium]MCV3728303.1 hypothetical protein [Ureaplasma miroungigenitalium]MCV3734108.1 hypothetical protein [Ureaplasma miroungigenitalium]